MSFSGRKDRVIASHSDIYSGVNFRSPLANYYIARHDFLHTAFLNSKPSSG